MRVKSFFAATALFFGLASQTYQAPIFQQPAQVKHVIEHEQKPAKKTWQEELYQIGLESTIDNIERGGIKLGNTAYEIENEVRYDGDKFKKFIDGENKHYGTLKSHLLSAKEVRCTCNPEDTAIYTISFVNLDTQLDQMLVFKEQRKLFDNPETWALFDLFLPHHIYKTDAEQHDALKGKITATKLIADILGTEIEEEGFHTHPGGSPPSLQDLKISQNRKEYVVSVTKEGDCTIYLAHKGKTEIVYTKKPDK